jgi:hypothetical protein
VADAMWALIGVAVGAGITGLVNWIQQSRQFAHDREMFTLKNKSADMVKAILAEMLNHRRYVERSFEALKKSVGGYSDEAIRQFLHEIGARRTERDDGAEEWWYLTSRQQERATRPRSGQTEELPLFADDEQRSEMPVEGATPAVSKPA